MTAIKVFCSMTEELSLQKYLKRFRELCQSVGRLLDVEVVVLHWKEMAGGLGDKAQDVIDKQAAGQNIYCGLMGTKFGRGTEHEYRTAVKGYIEDGSPGFVFFGFCEEKINPYKLDLPSFQKLKQFRNDIAGKKKYGKANLYFTFENMSQFEAAVQRNLKAGIEIIKGGVMGGPKFLIKPRSRKP